MNTENLNALCAGLVDRFCHDGMEVVTTVNGGRFKRWERIPDLGGARDLSFLIEKGLILRGNGKEIGLVLGLPETGSFLTPKELDFGVSIRGAVPSRNSDDGVGNLYRLVKYHGGDWSFGRFYEDLHGEIVSDCWANRLDFGGDNLKRVDINSAWEIVSRTIENGFKK